MNYSFIIPTCKSKLDLDDCVLELLYTIPSSPESRRLRALDMFDDVGNREELRVVIRCTSLTVAHKAEDPYYSGGGYKHTFQVEWKNSPSFETHYLDLPQDHLWIDEWTGERHPGGVLQSLEAKHKTDFVQNSLDRISDLILADGNPVDDVTMSIRICGTSLAGDYN